MKKFLLPLLAGLYFTNLAIAQENAPTTYYYTSPDVRGYISLQKSSTPTDSVPAVILSTTVKANFSGDPLNFTLTTTNDNEKMVAPSKLVFDGTIGPLLEPVHFSGERLKKDKKNNAYWQFTGDYEKEREKDPDLQRFTYPKYNATLRLPEPTIPSFNMWAIIPKLNFEREGTFIYNELDETKLFISKDRTVNYLGKFTTNINGKNVELHKFVQEGKGKLPNYYWVNDARELVQIELDDSRYTFTLTTPEEALKTTVTTALN